MTANTVNGSGNGARSGAQTLVLLATPLNHQILQALSDGPMQQGELRRATGLPAQTTLRAQLKRLVEIGAVEKTRRNRFPGAIEQELTKTGRDLIAVTEILGRWLQRAPEGPLSLGSPASKAAIKALTEGWSTTMMRALAARALTLTELDRVISSVNYPSLERRLGAMRLAGLVTTRAASGRGSPCEITRWGREAIGPLTAAARWELRHNPIATPPVGRLDIEAAFLLTVPLLRLPNDLSGACRFTAVVANGSEDRHAGVFVQVEEGRVVTCTTRLEGKADAWASGSAPAWIAAVVERDLNGLELGGDCAMARHLLDELYEALYNGRVLDTISPISKDGSN